MKFSSPGMPTAEREPTEVMTISCYLSDLPSMMDASGPVLPGRFLGKAYFAHAIKSSRVGRLEVPAKMATSRSKAFIGTPAFSET